MASANAPAKSGARRQYAAPAVRTTPKAMGEVLQSARDRLEAVLPKHLTPERMCHLVTTMMFRTPKLQECDSGSILASVIAASSLGLDLLPSLQEAFLIPRWNKDAGVTECQFQPGYQGLRKLALNTGRVALLETRLVRDGDVFEVDYEPDLRFVHRPRFGSGGEVMLVYSFAKLANGERSVEVMTAPEIEAIHQRTEGYRTAKAKGWEERGPWVTDWNEMARKTVLKRHCKSLPRSVELAEAIAADDREFRDFDGDADGVTVSRSPSRALTASGRLADRLAPPPPEPEDASQESPGYDPAEESQEVLDGSDEDNEAWHGEAGSRG